MMQTIPEGVDPTSIARKKRKEIISNLRHQNTNKRLKDDDPTVVSTVQDTGTGTDADTVSDNKPKTKYQNHYEPDVPMTKEQAAEWRKEARRKRNRESAAASRNKVRNRIAELEQEVQDWKDKYSTLLQRIETLEQQQQQQRLHQQNNRLNADCRDSSRVPTRLPFNHQLCVSPCLTPTLSPSSSETDEQPHHHHRHHQIVGDLHDSMVDQLKVPLDLEEEHFENSQPKIVPKDCNHLNTEDPMSLKITGELMVGFGQGTRNNNNGRNATEGGNAESLNNTLVSDTDSTTSCADCNSSVSEMDSLVEQDSMLGSFDLGLDSGAILDAHDEIGMLVKEALMDFVSEE